MADKGIFRQSFCGGIIPVCPVCDRGVNVVTDDKAKSVEGVLFHGPCSRFAPMVLTERLVCDCLELPNVHSPLEHTT